MQDIDRSRGLAVHDGDTGTAGVTITTIPPVVYTCEQGVISSDRPAKQRAGRDGLTWMFHLALESAAESPLRIEEVTVAFKRAGAVVVSETYSRDYLERMEWIAGRYELTPGYFLDHVQFGGEQPWTPDIDARGAISWVRVPFGLPRGVACDGLDFLFTFLDRDGTATHGEHHVPLVSRDQRATLSLPFTGTWIVIKGNDLSPITHRWTGLNGLTTFGWDSRPDADTLRAVSSKPDSIPVLAAGAGRVVHVRNDIDVEWNEATRDDLQRDGDLFAGNLVVIDHGSDEFTLTAHLQAGSVCVEVGQEVERGQQIARLGKLGFVHLNIMDRGRWLDALGVPGRLSDFERVRPDGTTEHVSQGNPATGWVVRN